MSLFWTSQRRNSTRDRRPLDRRAGGWVIAKLVPEYCPCRLGLSVVVCRWFISWSCEGGGYNNQQPHLPSTPPPRPTLSSLPPWATTAAAPSLWSPQNLALLLRIVLQSLDSAAVSQKVSNVFIRVRRIYISSCSPTSLLTLDPSQ